MNREARGRNIDRRIRVLILPPELRGGTFVHSPSNRSRTLIYLPARSRTLINLRLRLRRLRSVEVSGH
jgi:hypothetical protein